MSKEEGIRRLYEWIARRKMNKVVVTGGTRFVRPHLTENLASGEKWTS